jgi:hypothetical protein
MDELLIDIKFEFRKDVRACLKVDQFIDIKFEFRKEIEASLKISLQVADTF